MVPLELWSLRAGGLGLAWVSLVLLLNLGLGVGLVVAASQAWAGAWGLEGWARGALQALGSLLVTDRKSVV